DQISVPDPEIDESEISDDEDVDDSFDFADEETAPEPPKTQSSFDQTDLFGNKVSPKTEQTDLFNVSDVKADSEKAETTELAQAYGADTADFVSKNLQSFDKTTAKIARDLLDARKTVIAKGAEAKDILESASDALDLFRTAKEQNSTVAEVLQQPRLDGVTFSEQAQSFARSMEAGNFANVFGRSLSESKTETAKETVQAVQNEKIEDFGEKIGGAKKDLARKLAEVTGDDIKDKPLGKSFPRPDFAQLVGDAVITKEGAKFLNYLYDKIPAKPRKSYRVGSWVKSVESAIATFKDVIESDNTKNINYTERIAGTSDSSYLKRDYEIYSKTMDALGFPENKGTLGGYEIKKFDNKRSSKDEEFRTVYSIVKGNFIVKDFDSLDDAANGLKTILDGNKEAVKTTKFDLYQDRNTKEYFIGKKGATGVVRVMEGFKTSKEGRAFLTDKQIELENIWNGFKVKANERRAENRERIGTDWRRGENITPAKFTDTFGFRGVEFGNWVNNAERQTSINRAYDALMDMATALRISPKAVSLNGELGLAFGARGSGGVNPAAAHYERDKIVINLTKTNGAGSLGHEWWHALDNYFSRMRGKGGDYLTESPRQRMNRDGSMDVLVRPEMIEAFKGVTDAIKSSEMPKRSAELDKARTKLYWSTPIEMSARSFENFLINKLAQTNEQNDYLANFKEVGLWIGAGGMDLENYPYPLKDESENISNAFQNFFDTVEEKETENGNIALKSIASTNFIDLDKGVDMYLDGTLPAHKSLEVGEINSILQKLGMPARPIVLQQDVIRKTLEGKHKDKGVTSEILKDIPKLLEKPIAIIESDNPNAPKGTLLIVTRRETAIGGFVSIALQPNQTVNTINVNRIASIHPRDLELSFESWARKNQVRYLNKKMSLDLADGYGEKFTALVQSIQDSSTNLLTEENFVNNSPVKRAEVESSPEEFHEIKLAPASELIKLATVERNGDRLKVNLEAQEFIRRVMEETDIRAGRKKLGDAAVEGSFSGLFVDKESTARIVDTLRELAGDAQSKGRAKAQAFVENFANEIEAAASAGKGTVVAYMYDSRLPHEAFHQASYLGGAERNLTARHSNPALLDSHEAAKATADYLLGFDEYRNIKKENPAMFAALVREEAAAYIAGGEWSILGISEDAAADYMRTWMNSYLRKNAFDEKSGKIDENRAREIFANFEKIEGVTYETTRRIRESYEQYLAAKADEFSGAGGERVSGQSEQIRGRAARSDEGAFGGGQSKEGSGKPEVEKTTAPDRNQNLRALPATLRGAALDAEDLLYDVQTDTEAKSDAAEMLRNLGVAGAIDLIDNTVSPDASHANLAFMVAQVLQDHAARQESLGNAEEAAATRKLQAEFTRDLSQKFTKAGQFISAARVVQNNAVGVVASAEAIIIARGNTNEELSPDDRHKFQMLGEQSELAAAKLTELKRKLRNEQAKNKRLSDSLEGKTRRRTSSAQTARRQVADIVRQKHGGAVTSLIADLQAKFGMALPLAKRAELSETSENILKRIESDGGLDRLTIDQIAQVGALHLTDGLA
ncbi:MAG TPA: LPD5 domain-containing protein, partial [Pyrinomonadaceae bacterium]|nr:LPD5 domain-containing protein [Pyrinomonadaceae bacterium]